MKKGFGPIAIALVALVAIVAVEAVFLTNFVVRVESIKRTIVEGDIIANVNQMEIAKKAMADSLGLSYYQAFYDVASHGGFSGTCTPYWRTYDSTYFPSGLPDLFKQKVVENLNRYSSKLSSSLSVQIPSFTASDMAFEEKTVTGNGCSGTEQRCQDFPQATCNSQKGCFWGSLPVGIGRMFGCLGTATPCRLLSQTDCQTQTGCSYSQISRTYFAASASSSSDMEIPGTYEILEKTSLEKEVDSTIFNIFEIGKSMFVDSDALGSAIKGAAGGHACGDTKTSVTSDINSAVASVQSSMNSQYSSQKISFNLGVQGIAFDSACNSKVSVTVVVTIRNTSASFPSYDSSTAAVAMRNPTLSLYVLSGNLQASAQSPCQI